MLVKDGAGSPRSASTPATSAPSSAATKSTLKIRWTSSAKYRPGEPKQMWFYVLLALLISCLHLSFHCVNHPIFKTIFFFADPKLTVPTSKAMQRKHVPNLKKATKKEVRERLRDSLGSASSFDLWMSCKTEDIFSLNVHFLTKDFIWETVHLGLVNCDKGTSGEEVIIK